MLTLAIIQNTQIHTKPFDNSRQSAEFFTAWQTHRTKGAIVARLIQTNPDKKYKKGELEEEYLKDLSILKKGPQLDSHHRLNPLPNYIKTPSDRADRTFSFITEKNEDESKITVNDFKEHYDKERTNELQQILTLYYTQIKPLTTQSTTTWHRLITLMYGTK